MSETSTLIGYQGRTLSREELALVPTPLATETHRPVPHHQVINALDSDILAPGSAPKPAIGMTTMNTVSGG